MPKPIKLNADLEYYSFNAIDGYNAVYNFICGARGLGKTYGAKKKAITAAINNGEQFIYLRRFQTELPGFSTFFADIMHEFPDWDFRVEGRIAKMAPASTRDDKKRPWVVIGYAIALSNAQSVKSVAYPLVTRIIFDEFIIEQGVIRYLANEVKMMNDFYSTVDRWKDKTKVYFLANSIAINNPYFLEYNIAPEPDSDVEFIRAFDGFVVVHFPDSDAFKSGVLSTRFGQFIAGTDYAKYAVDSRFSDNHKKLIAAKTADAVYRCSIETRSGIFSVWFDYKNGSVIYIQDKRPKNEVMLTLESDLMDESKRRVVRQDKIMQVLRAAFNGGRIFFDRPKTRNAFLEIFKGY